MNMNEETKTNMKFKAVLPASSLKAALRAIKSVGDEAVLSVTPNGMGVLLADAVNSLMIDMNLSRSAFTAFENTNFYEMEIDVERLTKMVAVADDGDLITLEQSADEKNLIISFGVSFGGYFRYELELLTGVRRDVDVFTNPDTASVGMSGFVQMVAAVEAVSGELVQIGVGADGIFMEAVGEEGLPKRTKVSMVIAAAGTETERRTALYSLDYLQAIGRGVPYGRVVELGIATDYPLLVVEFMCCTGGRVKYILAPRIETD